MGKTIKVIDLFNMIANRDELPKKIKWDGVEFYLKDGSYKHFEEEDCITEDFANYLTLSMMNDEVEILDEEDEIDIQKIPELTIAKSNGDYDEYSEY